VTAAASMQSMEGTGMAGSGTPPGRAATAAVEVAVAATEVAMAPATAAAMAEGVEAAVAAGTERSSQPATGIFLCFSRVEFFICSLYLPKYVPISRQQM
jgi:hypothetical protein